MATDSQQQWEHCEIVFEITNEGFFFSNFGVKSRFWAQGFNPQGTYTVAVSDVELSGMPLPYSSHKAAQAVDSLEGNLLIDGWEPLSRGLHWFSRKYRRRVQP